MIKTSSHIPIINKNTISREALLTKLDCILQSRLTLIVAPAGYGKTTAVVDWLGKCRYPAAWLSLNSYNSTPSAFWRSVCEAADDISPGIQRDSEYILGSHELLEAKILIKMLLDAVSKVDSDLIFIVDDAHLITDPSILEDLTYYIDYLPQKLHLVLIGRTQPDLELTRLRIKLQINMINAKDLRFQKEDIYHFYQARGFLLEAGEVERLEKYSEGWIASLVAVAMTMERTNESHVVSSLLPVLKRDIGRYLRDEVMTGWSEEKRIFAMKTSVLDTLSDELCDAVTSGRNGRLMLTEIDRDNAFLLALDESGKEYRFHFLFRDFLYNLLTEMDEELVPKLHARAGLWYKAHGVINKAVEHFLSAGQYEDALKLIERKDVHCYTYDNNLLLSWIERLPKSLRDSSFKVAYIYTQCYIQAERFDLVQIWGERMRSLAASPAYASDPETLAFCRIALAFSDTTRQLKEGDTSFFKPLMSAFELFDEKYYKMPDYVDFNSSDIYFYRCSYNLLIQFFNENRDMYQTSVDKFRTLISRNPGYKPLVAGEFLYESNRLEEAMPYLLETLEEAEAAQCPGALVPAFANIVRMKRASNDFTGAFRTLDECDSILGTWGKVHWRYMLQALRCRLYIDLCDAEKVDAWLASCMLDSYMEINKTREFELIVYSRALIFKNCLSDADILLQRLLAFDQKANRNHSMVEVLNLLALLEYSRGKQQRACEYLNKSLCVGTDKQYVRSYLDEGACMAKLLSAYIKQTDTFDEKNVGFAVFLLNEMTQRKADELDTLFESLTPREWEVLRLLLDAYTNSEISEKMGVTLQTVKYHIGNIYGKLNVKNRAQCLKLAQDYSIGQ